MYQRLPSQEKIRFIKRVQAGEPVTKVCREAGISRTIFYQWLKKYQQAGPRAKKTVLTPKVVKGKKHWKRLPLGTERKILKTALKHPSFSPQKIGQLARISPHGAWNVLKRNGLNTQSAREAYLYKYGPSLIKPLTVEDKLVMMRRLEEGEKVAHICREFGISRTAFYKWLKRYQKASDDLKREVLESWRPKEKKHWRFVPEAKELVLKIIVEHPELSCQKISQRLPLKEGKPILGSHGIWNLLKRLNLNTYEVRLAYVQAQTPVITPAFGLPATIRRLIGRIPVISAIPPPVMEKIASLIHPLVFSFLFSIIFSNIFIYWLRLIVQIPTPEVRLGLFFASISLLVGSLFFIYSMKYYFTLAVVLSFSRQPASPDGSQGGPGESAVLGLNGEFKKNGNGGWLSRIFGLNGLNGENGGNGRNGMVAAGGLQPSLDHIKLKRYPFISIHLPFYNEKKVAERILKACTSMDYENYEVIVIDDSTDETTEIVQRHANKHNKAYPHGPKIKVLHRPTREGFKGGALREALRASDPRTEFVVVFDADFIPYPDTLELFMKYFQSVAGTLDFADENRIAAVTGYQWHVLNKSENWITRGVRTEYAGSYVIERSGQEILGVMKLIHGSVYAVRADVLRKFGWGTSITEDFELTLKLYEQGYKVVYTPYVQAPAECASTIKRLIRQRMRWAEGHSHCVKKMFLRLLMSPKMTLAEKAEFLYLSPYYLQAFFFLIGTFSWLLAETVFRARLPFWTSLWGWSMVLTNFFALPLMNAVGLFLEEAEEKDYLGLLSFVALSYILVPFQAYASVKGFLEKEEGPWFRTPKTGLITDIFTRGRFYRWISGILPGRRPAPALARNELRYSGIADFNPRPNPYLALATANNQFNNFHIKPRRMKWIGKMALVFLLIISLTIYSLSGTMVKPAYATIGIGDGTDGAISLSANTNCQTTDISTDDGDTTADCIATYVSATSNSGQAVLNIASTTGFYEGDEVFIVTILGTGQGQYEFKTITTGGVGAGTLTMTANLTYNYSYTSDVNESMVVRVPQYSSVTTNGYSLTVSAYSTTNNTGGVLVFRATGTVTASSGGSITTTGLGFPGGAQRSGGAGGGTNASGGAATTGNNGTGPGAGTGGGAGGNPGGGSNSKGGGGAGGTGGGGGGGAYAASGTAGTAGTSGTGGDGGAGGANNGGTGSAGSGGSAGSLYGGATLSSLYFGSGGGSGAGGAGGGGGDYDSLLPSESKGGTGGYGGAGGNSGGIIYIVADTITVSGGITNNGNGGSNGNVGGAGGNCTITGTAAAGGAAPGSGGGGGAGGSIFLRGGTLTLGSNLVTATAGTGGSGAGTGRDGGSCVGYAGGSASGGAGGGGATGTKAGKAATGGSAGGGGAGNVGRVHIEYLDKGTSITNPSEDELVIPEKLLIFIPLAIFLPKIVEWLQERRRKSQKLPLDKPLKMFQN